MVCAPFWHYKIGIHPVVDSELLRTRYAFLRPAHMICDGVPVGCPGRASCWSTCTWSQEAGPARSGCGGGLPRTLPAQHRSACSTPLTRSNLLRAFPSPAAQFWQVPPQQTSLEPHQRPNLRCCLMPCSRMRQIWLRTWPAARLVTQALLQCPVYSMFSSSLRCKQPLAMTGGVVQTGGNRSA